MPLQHVSDRMLKRMNRSSTEKSIKDKIAELRRAMPDIAIRTNFIVGFPGRDERGFQQAAGFREKDPLRQCGRLQIFKGTRNPGRGPARAGPGGGQEERLEALISAQSRVLDVDKLGA